MSFSAEVKKELCGIEDKSCCRRAELAGLAAFCGSMVTGEGGKQFLRLRTENPTVARRMYALSKSLFHTPLAVRHAMSTGLYSITIQKSTELDVLMQRLGLIQEGRVKFSLDPFLAQDDCCARAYVRGAFLGGGSLSEPEKSYHFEIVTHYKTLSGDLSRLLADYGFELKTIFRKGYYVTYAKDSEVISDLLAFMGASGAMMELYNVKILKDMRNNVNRRVNCETANLTKTADAAVRQIQCIKKIEKLRGLDSLPESLQTIAQLRMDNPEASLLELGNMLQPPIGKSGVNHRLKKIVDIADSL